MDNAGFEGKEKNYGSLDDVEAVAHSPKNGSRKATDIKRKDKPEPEENKRVEALKTVLNHEDLDEDFEPNIFGRAVVNVRSNLYKFVTRRTFFMRALLILVAVLLYHAYLVAAIVYTLNYKSIDWCNNVGFLIIITGISYWAFFYYFVLKRLLGKRIQRGIINPLRRHLGPALSNPYVSYGLGFLVLAAAIAFIVVDAWEQKQRLVSAAGVFVILALGLLFSKYPGRIKWRQVFWGIGLQFLFGVLIIRWSGGRDAFDCISGKVKTFLAFTDEGSGFVYGYIATGLNITIPGTGDTFKLPTIFYFSSLSVVFFFSFFISLLYHFGIMMWIIRKLGWFLQITVGTTAAESMNAAANIFVGQTEAPILIKPFVPAMTRSELHAVMTGGFATISGSVLGAYIGFGINPSYLLSSSIMAAPAALAMSKLLYPETKKSQTTAEDMKSIKLKKSGNALDAATQGATQAVILVLNIGANIIAITAFVAFLNQVINWFGVVIGIDYLSFEWLLAKIFIPFAYILGVDPEEVEDVALLLGLKTVINEFVAYERLVSDDFARLSERSRAIATYALCSFANLSSIGIQLGGIGVMSPERRQDLAETISYAFLAGSACGLLNACVAGTLISADGYQSFTNITTTTSSSLY